MEHNCSNYGGSDGCSKCLADLTEENAKLRVEVERLKVLASHNSMPTCMEGCDSPALYCDCIRLQQRCMMNHEDFAALVEKLRDNPMNDKVAQEVFEAWDSVNLQVGVLTRVLRDAEKFHDIVRSECGEGDGKRYLAYDCLRDSMRAANGILGKTKKRLEGP